MVNSGSDNHDLVPEASLIFGSSDTSRTLTITPATGQVGSSSIKVTISDGEHSTTYTFTFTVGTGKTWNLATWDDALWDAEQLSITLDADQDGMMDEWELTHNLDSTDSADASLDNDNDGLFNLGEYKANTNPHISDSDGDGLSDGVEIQQGSNPNDPNDTGQQGGGSTWDSGAWDKTKWDDETISSQDNDQDDMPDAWEIEHSLNPNDQADASLDRDSDGLSNVEEYNSQTDPNIADTDGDGLSDGVEIQQGSNPNDPNDTGQQGGGSTWDSGTWDEAKWDDETLSSQDNDQDDMPDAWEIEHSLNPDDQADASLDRDNDGLSNVEEYNSQTDPNVADTDGDGLSDGVEIQQDSNPNDPNDTGQQNGGSAWDSGVWDETKWDDGASSTDTDHDGMPDTWETGHGLNAYDPNDGTIDSDNDGLSNVEEYQIETNPQNPDTDADQIPDGEDPFPNDTGKLLDTDADGVADSEDTDKDGDGITDSEDPFPLLVTVSGTVVKPDETGTTTTIAGVEVNLHSLDFQTQFFVKTGEDGTFQANVDPGKQYVIEAFPQWCDESSTDYESCKTSRMDFMGGNLVVDPENANVVRNKRNEPVILASSVTDTSVEGTILAIWEPEVVTLFKVDNPISLNIVIDSGQELTGRLVDSSGTGIEGAFVDSDFGGTTTKFDGTFVLTTPTTAQTLDIFKVRILPQRCDQQSPDFETCESSRVGFVGGVVVLTGEGEYQLSTDEENGASFKTDGSDWIEGLVITTSAGITITGHVTNGTQGIPEVWVDAWSHTTFTGNGVSTDSEGYFSIRIEPPSSEGAIYYEVGIWTPDFVTPEPVLVKIEASGMTGVYNIKDGTHPGNAIDETATPAVNFTVTQGNSISGRVVDSTGQGIAQVWVDIHNRNFTNFFGASTDEDGYYEVNVEPGRYVAVVWGNGENLRSTWYHQATDERDATIINATSGRKENINFRMSSGTTINGTITGGTTGDVFISAWSERTRSWSGKDVVLDASGTTTFTISGLQEANDYRLDWFSDSYMSGFYGGALSAEASGPVGWNKATLLNTTNGNIFGVNITLSSGNTLALTVTGMEVGEMVDAGLWSDVLDQGGWAEASVDATSGVATLVINNLGSTGTDYRLFVNSSSGEYKMGNFKGAPATTTDSDFSDGDNTEMESGTLVNWEQATLISMADNVSVKVAMDSGGSISGTVSGLSSGQFAWIEAFSERTHAWGGTEVVGNDDGAAVDYAINGLKRVKDYRINISGSGVKGGFYSGDETLSNWNNAARIDIKTVPDGEKNGNASNINVTLSAGASISGSVEGLQNNEWAWIDAWSDSTFSWAGITVEGGTETSGASVSYKLDGLASASDYEVSLNADGYVQQHKENVDATSNITGIDFTVFTGGKISGSLSGLGAVDFVWIDAFSKTNGAWGGVGATTASDGAATYTIDGLSYATDYVVALRTEGRTFFYKTDGITPVRSQHEEVTVTSGTTNGIDFDLSSADNMVFKLSGAITLNPVNDDQLVDIMAWSTDGAGVQVSRIGSGDYTLKGLPSGNYTVEAVSDGYAPQRTKTVTVSSGVVDSSTWTNGWSDMGTIAVTESTSGLNATLSTGFSISGTVTASAGAVSGAWVNAWDNVNSIGSGAVTNSSGAYSIEGLPIGTYSVEVWTPSGKKTHSVTLVDADATGTDLAIMKESGGISGTVTNSSKIVKQGVLVLIFDSNGSQVAATTTNSSGAFKVEGLVPNQTYSVKVYGDDNFSEDYSYQEKADVDVGEATSDVGTLELSAPSGS